MAEMGHTVCVRGLPAHLEHERLHDKLLIHFLRERNGGGEISSISIKATDPCAAITFEDSRVALNVCSHKPHVLSVDGKTYELSVSYPWQESQHLNKVILDMSVTIDCTHLPLGEETIKNLTEKFPSIGVHCVKPQRYWTLKGPYSEVNEVVSHLAKLLLDFKTPNDESLLFARDSKRVHLHQKGKDNPPDQPHASYSGGDVSLHQESRYPSPKVNSVKISQAQTCSEKKIKDWVDAVDVEAQSLIMEADVFAYLCSRSEEYRSILQKHEVDVVHVTSAGLATLYLQSSTNVKAGSKHLNHARKELNQLYQQVEGNLRRDQIPKSALNLRGEQNAAFKDLESLLPNVMLSFDQTHIYIVGESSDVSQAKQILLFGSSYEKYRPKPDTSLPSSSSYSSISESETTQITGASTEPSTMTPKMRISNSERKIRTGEEYKLAARFKNSDLGLLGFGPVERGKTREHQDFTKDHSTLTLTSYSSLGTAGAVSGDQARASQISAFKVTGVNNVDDDILFQKTEPLSFTCTFKNSGEVSKKVGMTSSTSRVTPSFKAPLSTPVDALTDALTGLENVGKTTGSTLESTTTTTTTTSSSLRRTSSFSGRPLQKQETQKTGNDEKTCLATNSFRRPRSSSLNGRKSTEGPPSSTVSRALNVPTLMWNYIKEAYQSDVNSLISDLQVSENHVDMYKTMVILKGSSLSKVEERQRKLQKLVDVIGLDFCVQNLQLAADLGVMESNDMLKECCSNIRSHLSKIVLQHGKDAIFLMGPKSLCSQATEMLKELFPNGFSNSGSLVNAFTYQRSIEERQANSSAKEMPIKSNSQIRPNQTKSISESPAKGRLKGYKSEPTDAAYMHLPKPVAKEMLKKDSDLEINKTGRSSEVSGVLGHRDDWQKASSLTTQKSQKATTLTLKQTNMPVSKQLSLTSCVCGENGAQTSCGIFLCSNCIPLHSQCMVCSKVNAASKASTEMRVHPLKEDQNTEELNGKEAGTRQKQDRAIQGTMRFTELSMSLPGYEQYRTAKITYCIPDGIQGEEHPNPGLPFQGGVFEAYLPLSSKGQGLLQCLEKAFKQGFTFTVCPRTSVGRAKITWSRIPHKTNITGGRSLNGYPDSIYLKDLSVALRTCGIEEV